jgi:hypothetical protein
VEFRSLWLTTHVAKTRETRITYKILLGKHLLECGHLEDQKVDRITMSWILIEQIVRTGGGWSCFIIVPNGSNVEPSCCSASFASSNLQIFLFSWIQGTAGFATETWCVTHKKVTSSPSGLTATASVTCDSWLNYFLSPSSTGHNLSLLIC